MTQNNNSTTLDDRWIRAAVVGGLWASFEIVLGSFLHNLHLPFVGTTMAFIVTIFVIAFYRMWPVKGLIWRAGLICALMKSVSPSAVILGPMIGIFLEALVLELVIRIGGNNLITILLAGAASQLSPLMHKVGGMLIRYGWDIVRIYENMFEYAIRQFDKIEISPLRALMFLLLIYLVAGVLAAFLGYSLGRKTAAGNNSQIPANASLDKNNSWAAVDSTQKFSVFLFILHLAVLPFLLFLFRKNGTHPVTLSFFSAYLVFLLTWYGRIKFRLMKPVFWVHLVIIGLMAGLFWKPEDNTAATASQWEGWIIGMMLILRAVLVISVFSALSTEMRNPRMAAFLVRLGFGKVYNAVSMAFSALPLMMERGKKGWEFMSHPVRAVRALLVDAEDWFNVLRQDQSG